MFWCDRCDKLESCDCPKSPEEAAQAARASVTLAAKAAYAPTQSYSGPPSPVGDALWLRDPSPSWMCAHLFSEGADKSQCRLVHRTSSIRAATGRDRLCKPCQRGHRQ